MSEEENYFYRGSGRLPPSSSYSESVYSQQKRKADEDCDEEVADLAERFEALSCSHVEKRTRKFIVAVPSEQHIRRSKGSVSHRPSFDTESHRKRATFDCEPTKHGMEYTGLCALSKSKNSKSQPVMVIHEKAADSLSSSEDIANFVLSSSNKVYPMMKILLNDNGIKDEHEDWRTTKGDNGAQGNTEVPGYKMSFA